jgi:hypothetical protein
VGLNEKPCRAVRLLWPPQFGGKSTKVVR